LSRQPKPRPYAHARSDRLPTQCALEICARAAGGCDPSIASDNSGSAVDPTAADAPDREDGEPAENAEVAALPLEGKAISQNANGAHDQAPAAEQLEAEGKSAAGGELEESVASEEEEEEEDEWKEGGVPSKTSKAQAPSRATRGGKSAARGAGAVGAGRGGRGAKRGSTAAPRGRSRAKKGGAAEGEETGGEVEVAAAAAADEGNKGKAGGGSKAARGKPLSHMTRHDALNPKP